jgi:signal transduction histidine kinase
MASVDAAEPSKARPDRPPPAGLIDQRTRALLQVGQARVSNAWLRLGSCAIVAVVAMSIVGNLWPIAWWVGLCVVLFIDRALYQRLLQAIDVGATPSMIGLVVWTVGQSIYGNLLAVMLWFAPYVPGESLAVIYLCGGLANAIATLRAHAGLMLAGAVPTIGFLMGLPIFEFFANGASNTSDLMLVVGALLLLGFGVNLWKSLLASDAAHARAEEAAIREQQAAAAAAAAKTDTIQRMNDELRTPMMALIGAAEHLHRVAATPSARAHIATLVQAGEVLKQVLDDLTDLDQLENGSLSVEPEPASVRDVVRSVVSAFRSAAHDKSLELFADISGDMPTSVAMDALRVRQILFNLLANAVRYTQHGGVRVRVTAQVAPLPGRVRLSFAIADTGVGMSRAQLAAIFNRDRIASAGDGIGLAISLRLARAMGGTITAKSEPGEGSVFTFIFDAPVVSRGATAAA